MKKINLIGFVTVILCCILLFSACDGIGEFLKTAVWAYSEEGDQEITMNFLAFNADGEASGAFEWHFRFIGESQKDIILYAFLQKSAEEKKLKCAFNDNEVGYVYLELDDDKYFINKTEDTFKTPSEELSESEVLLAKMLQYGIVELKNAQGRANWNFVSKNDVSKMLDNDGMEEEVVTYVYESEEGTAGNKTRLRFDFKKALIPLIVRMQYEIFVDGVIKETIIIYRILDTTAKIDEDTFIAPITVEE